MVRVAGRLAFVVAAVLALVPGWSGEERLARYGPRPSLSVRPVTLDPDDPARRRVGRLTFVSGIALASDDPAFGGFSALAIAGDRVTLLSDGGNVLRFRISGGRIADVRFGDLPGGPATGWDKRHRDSESLTTDGRQAWVGFEWANAIWRYSVDLGRVTGFVRPRAMREWRSGGGAESMLRWPDGRFLVLSEEPPKHRSGARQGLVFAGDPVETREPAFRFGFEPPAGYDPSDAALLPDGRLLVLVRRFALPFRFGNKLVLVDPAAIRPGATVRGRVVATLETPLIHDNFEGLAVTVERGQPMLWLVSDDNQTWLERTLLLKFRFDG